MLLAGGLLVLAAAAIGAGASKGKNAPFWVLAASAGVALLLPVVMEPIKELYKSSVLRGIEIPRMLRREFLLVNEKGRAPIVRDILNPLLLRVHPAATVTDTSAQKLLLEQGLVGSVPPYVRRDCEAALEDAISSGGLVLLEGASASGKTRTAYEVMRRTMPDRRLLVPKGAASLRELVEMAPPHEPTVIWLDDLERFLTQSGLDAHLMHRLAPPGTTRTILLATLRTEARRGLVPSASAAHSTEQDMARNAYELLQQARVVTIPRAMSPDERSRAEALNWDPRIAEALDHADPVGFTEYLAAGPAAVARWVRGREGENPNGAAIVTSAVACRVAGFSGALSEDILREIYVDYLPPTLAAHSGATFEEGLDWALVPVEGASSCLVRSPSGGLQPFDYLLDHIQDGAPRLEVSDKTWDAILNILTPERSMGVGLTAYQQDRRDLAEKAYLVGTASKQEGIRAANAANLGFLYENLRDLSKAEHWLQVATDLGDTHAAFHLAMDHMYARKDPHAAERVFRELLRKEPENCNATGALAIALVKEGRIEEGIETFQHALNLWEQGGAEDLELYSMLAFNLSEAYRGLPDPEREYYWANASAEAGSVRAKFKVGVLLTDRGEDEAAKQLFEEVATSDEEPSGWPPVRAYAAYNLGVLLGKQRDYIDAARWFELAFDGGQVHAAADAAHMLEQEAEYDRAASLYDRGSQAGDGHAMYHLGRNLEREGEYELAENWYMRSAEKKFYAAMDRLAERARTRGDEEGALDWTRKAREAEAEHGSSHG